MTYTLSGRIQTRLVLIATVGMVWTALVTPFIPSASMAQMGMGMIMTKFMTTIVIGPNQSLLYVNYQMGFETLGIMAGLGIAWECLYHFLQQFRWDKDWPVLFSLLALVPEAVALWFGAHALGVFPDDGYGLGFSSPEMEMYVIHIATTWLVIWLVALGPLRVLAPTWRFHGGEFVRLPGRGRVRSAAAERAGKVQRGEHSAPAKPSRRQPAASPPVKVAKPDLISQQ